MGPRPEPAMVTRTLLLCVGITWLIHVVTYLLNTQLPLHVVALGGTRGQVGWLFAANTGIAMVLRPQVGNWVERYGARAVMLAGAGMLVLTMGALDLSASPLGVIAPMVGLGIALALVSTSGSIVVAEQSPASRRGEALSLYYVASSVGVAIGPPAGFALAAVGGMALDFGVVTLLSLVVAGLTVAVRTPPGRPGRPWAFGRPWSRHAVPASVALIIVTMGHTTVYAFLPMHAAAAGLGNAAWFFPLMSGCTIASRLLLRRASDQFGRARRPSRHRQLDALPDVRRARRRPRPPCRAGTGHRHAVGGVGHGRVHRGPARGVAGAGPRLLRRLPGQRARGRSRPRRLPRHRARSPALPRPRQRHQLIGRARLTPGGLSTHAGPRRPPRAPDPSPGRSRS
jgi:hypothetical protein